MHGNLTGAYDIRQRRGAQPRRRHQQDADRPQSRLRRAAGLFRAGAADAAHRRRTRARSARRDHAAISFRPMRFPIARRPARCSIPAITSRRSSAASSDGGLAELQAAARCGARRRPALRHRLYRGGRAQRFQHGLHHDRADARPSAARPARRTARRRPRPSRSIRSAASPCMSRRCRRGRAIARCWRRSSPMCFGLTPADIRVNTEIDTAQGRLVDRVRQLRQPLRRRRSPAPPSSRPNASRRGSRASRPRQLNVDVDDIVFAGGRVRSQRNPDNASPFSRRRRAQPLVAGHAARRRSGRPSARPCSGRRRN